MHSEAVAHRKGVLILLLACAVVCAQAMSFVSQQSHHNGSEHCCALCHAGPLPFLQPVVAAACAPALSVAWLEWIHDAQVREPREIAVGDEL